MFTRSEGLKVVREEWHVRRQKARESAFSLAEFGPHEIEEFDLESAGVDGRDNPRTYQGRRPLDSDGEYDLRELDTR